MSGPFSKLGQNTNVPSKNATCMSRCRPISRSTRCGTRRSVRKLNQEQAFLPVYSYAAVTDSVEGLILVNIETLADGEFRNNFLKRAVTWNPDGVLNGARHMSSLPGRSPTSPPTPGWWWSISPTRSTRGSRRCAR
ncbi:MAG: hypothetical protein P0Y64_04180 [Candidatus Sphingomonas colombiensis]|nr:hypothetical protein [Sphingomonas sp.]WEK44037.1 MAG: hypothetical protein P0Y64_04180 [Sphingomonas sp.]